MPDEPANVQRRTPGGLAGRTAVVTGASSGIGRAVAHALVSAGSRVVLLARRARALEELARSLGPLASAARCDLTRADDVRDAAAGIIEALGGAPHVLVNNAGAFVVAPIEAMEPDAFVQSIETNLIGPFLLARAFVPAMRARGDGHVVTVGSIADRHIFPGNGAYAASKHGARALHEVLREELRGSGVRATLVSPGPVDTPLWDEIDPDSREGFTPRARMLTADAVADAIMYAVTRPATVNVDELRLSRS